MATRWTRTSALSPTRPADRPAAALPHRRDLQSRQPPLGRWPRLECTLMGRPWLLQPRRLRSRVLKKIVFLPRHTVASIASGRSPPRPLRGHRGGSGRSAMTGLRRAAGRTGLEIGRRGLLAGASALAATTVVGFPAIRTRAAADPQGRHLRRLLQGFVRRAHLPGLHRGDRDRDRIRSRSRPARPGWSSS